MPSPVYSSVTFSATGITAADLPLAMPPINIPAGATLVLSAQTINQGIFGQFVSPLDDSVGGVWFHQASTSHNESNIYESVIATFFNHPGGIGAVIHLGGSLSANPVDVNILILIVENIDANTGGWSTTCPYDPNPDAFALGHTTTAGATFDADTSAGGGSPVTQPKEALISLCQTDNDAADPTVADTFTFIASFKGQAFARLEVVVTGDYTSTWNQTGNDISTVTILGMVFDEVPPFSGGHLLSSLGAGT